MHHDSADNIPEPTPGDITRIQAVLKTIGGRDVTWGAQATLDVWVIEQRARLDRQMADRLRRSSWALVAATIGLAVCTAGLIWATVAGG